MMIYALWCYPIYRREKGNKECVLSASIRKEWVALMKRGSMDVHYRQRPHVKMLPGFWITKYVNAIMTSDSFYP